MAEETEVRPKPMVKIARGPILRHVMKRIDNLRLEKLPAARE